MNTAFKLNKYVIQVVLEQINDVLKAPETVYQGARKQRQMTIPLNQVVQLFSVW